MSEAKTLLQLELPVPPSANKWAQQRYNRFSAEAKAIRGAVEGYVWCVKAAVADAPVTLPLTQPLHVHIELHHSSMDLDNVRKVLNDSLTKAGVISDDRIIVADSGRKHRSKRNAQRVIVTIMEDEA